MDRLITVDDVKARMALPDVDIDDFVGSAIDAAQMHIASVFGSELGKVTGQTDTFFIDPNANNSLTPGGFYRLKLRRGLLTSAPVLTTGYGWGDTVPLGALVAGQHYQPLGAVDLERGIIRLGNVIGRDSVDFFSQSLNTYVNVTYNAGYQAGDDIPDWLKEAILAYVPVVFNFGPSTQSDPEAKVGYTASGDHAMAVMALHNRFQPFTLKPL